jgi:large subunit ribosomal protein L24
MPGHKIKKNDTVIVISGKDRGKKGRVIEVLPKKGRVRVEGVARIKRHTKPNPQRNVKGGIVERENPIHVSNVAIIDPKSDTPTRLRMKVLPNGTRVRVAAKSGLPIDK